MNPFLFLVDDVADDRLIFRDAVQEVNPNARLETAKQAEAALDQLAQLNELPHALVIDVNLPGMDGVELLKAIRAHAAYRV